MGHGVRAALADQRERRPQDGLAPRLPPWYIRSADAYKCTDEDGQRRDQLRGSLLALGAGQLGATEIDFSEDARQWHEEFTDFERKAALWNYALFFWGEDAVADSLSPYIDAAPLEEQKYFLATQQVDEARHAVFFKRFMHEVGGIGDGTSARGSRRSSRG